VLDASRVIGVVTKLLSPDSKPGYLSEVKITQERQRTEFADRQQSARKLLTITEASRSPAAIRLGDS
jgi:5-methyltetrahydrofolate--homocysteine methyltransferase